MSLPYVVVPSPNRFLVSPARSYAPAKTRYAKWLQQLTINAVERALLYRPDSKGLTDTVEACGSYGYCCSKALRLCALRKKTQSLARSTNWSLDKDSEDRRHVAAKIYAVLVNWSSDNSFEWRARVAAAVHVIEEAMYLRATSKEQYSNPSMLKFQLRQVLQHFEAGNGQCLLQGSPPIYPLVPPPFPNADSNGTESPICFPMIQMSPRPSLLQEVTTPDRIIMHENQGVVSPECVVYQTQKLQTLGSLLEMQILSQEVSLWEAVLRGQTKGLEKLYECKDRASKRLLRKTVTAVSKKRREEKNNLKYEIRKAMADGDPDRLVNLLATVNRAYSCELVDLCTTAESMLIKYVKEREKETERRERF